MGTLSSLEFEARNMHNWHNRGLFSLNVWSELQGYERGEGVISYLAHLTDKYGVEVSRDGKVR